MDVHREIQEIAAEAAHDLLKGEAYVRHGAEAQLAKLLVRAIEELWEEGYGLDRDMAMEFSRRMRRALENKDSR